jgi:hypothetical protein
MSTRRIRTGPRLLRTQSRVCSHMLPGGMSLGICHLAGHPRSTSITLQAHAHLHDYHRIDVRHDTRQADTETKTQPARARQRREHNEAEAVDAHFGKKQQQ